MSAAAAIDWRYQTARIRARLIEAHDRGMYLDLYTSPDVMAQIGPAMSVGAATAMFEQALRQSHDAAALARHWQIADRQSGEGLGIVALVRRKRVPAHGEIGTMLLPQAQGRGFGLDALNGLVDAVIARRCGPRIDRLIIRHTAGNLTVERIAIGLGFQRQPGEVDNLVEWWFDPALRHRLGEGRPSELYDETVRSRRSRTLESNE
jgi:RimJ/RimL family protein N-acetyltransferase